MGSQALVCEGVLLSTALCSASDGGGTLVAGKMVYHGPREDIIPFFESQGMHCPERKADSDFLQEVTSRKDQKVLHERLALCCRALLNALLQCLWNILKHVARYHLVIRMYGVLCKPSITSLIATAPAIRSDFTLKTWFPRSCRKLASANSDAGAR